MAQERDLDERDRRLLHALQIWPRAPWTAIAPVVGADPVTLARRWAQLREAGYAWVAAYPAEGAGSVSAFLELECPPARVAQVVTQITDDPEVLTVDVTAGGRDMLVTLLCPSDTAFARYMLQRVPEVSGIRSMRTHRVTHMITDARRWRLRELDRAEVSRLERAVPVSPTDRAQIAASLEADLLRLLSSDGRMSVTDLSRQLGLTTARGSRLVTTVLARRRIVVRTEVARRLSGWPVYAWFFLRVPPRELGQASTKLSGLDEVRLVALTVGPFNLVMAVWLRRIEDVQRLETLLVERLPNAQVEDRSIVLQTPKHLGIRLDPDGYRLPG